MLQRHKRTKTQHDTTLKSNIESINININSQQNPQQYLLNSLIKACENNKINTQKMSIKQLSILMLQLNILLKNKQLHQLYIYSTYQYNRGKTNQNKITSVVNIQINNINLAIVARWLLRRIKKNKIQFNTQDKKINKQKQKQRQRKHHYTQSFDLKQSTIKYKLLPQIKTRPTNIFTNQVTKVLGLFSQMQKQRQNAGLQPVCISDQQQDDRSQPIKQLRYQGDFFEVNQKISTLRQQAQRRIEKVIDATKHDKKLKLKFQQALMRYQKIRNQANQKMGKCGAMKAQKRIFDKQKIQIKQIQLWRQKTNQTQLKTQKY